MNSLSIKKCVCAAFWFQNVVFHLFIIQIRDKFYHNCQCGESNRFLGIILDIHMICCLAR